MAMARPERVFITCLITTQALSGAREITEKAQVLKMHFGGLSSKHPLPSLLVATHLQQLMMPMDATRSHGHYMARILNHSQERMTAVGK